MNNRHPNVFIENKVPFNTKIGGVILVELVVIE